MAYFESRSHEEPARLYGFVNQGCSCIASKCTNPKEENEWESTLDSYYQRLIDQTEHGSRRCPYLASERSVAAPSITPLTGLGFLEASNIPLFNPIPPAFTDPVYAAWEESIPYSVIETPSSPALSPDQDCGGVIQDVRDGYVDWTVRDNTVYGTFNFVDLTSNQDDHKLTEDPRPRDTSLPLSAEDPKRPRCKECGQSFTKNNDLKRHVQSRHQKDDIPKFQCICGKQDHRKDNYKRHVEKCRQRLFSFYTCKCGMQHADKDEHLNHVRPCDYGFHGAAGRPRNPTTPDHRSQI
ncbi:hypothetical protein M426DRAFT_9358 [Hypoxylon sp. CI-4A]|nr:hypothetical protein M426DRAFT_9358 [Hypoxylon sp. CI-4A]